MYIQKLELYQFRNFLQQSLEFEMGIQLFLGENGTGKTNLIEAIYLGCMGFTQRTKRDTEIVNWGNTEYSIGIEGIRKDQTLNLRIKCKLPTKKEIWLDENKVPKVSDIIGKFPVVWCAPEDLGLVTEGPAERRRYIDIILSQIDPQYFLTLKKYHQILKQKNTLLRDFGDSDRDLLATYNLQLVDLNTNIMSRRHDFCEIISEIAKEIYRKISQDKEILTVKYEPSIPGKNYEEWRSSFKEILDKKKEEEIRLKRSIYGSHRDNLLLLLSGRPANLSGSQGQKRLVSISLRFAEAAYLESVLGVSPLLLLDDIFAELDESRRKILSKIISQKKQVFIASPRMGDLPFEVDKVFHVMNGVVC